jgi:hypothetical protein
VRASTRVSVPFGWGERHRVEGLHQRVLVPCTAMSGVPGRRRGHLIVRWVPLVPLECWCRGRSSPVAVRGWCSIAVSAGNAAKRAAILRKGGEGLLRWWWAAIWPHLQGASPGLTEGRVRPWWCVTLGTRRRNTARKLLPAAAATTTATTVGVLPAIAAGRPKGTLWSHLVPLARRVGGCGRAGRGRLLRRRDEGRRWRRRPGVDLQLLQQEMGTCLSKRREGAVHPEDRHHVLEFSAQATEQGEDHLTIAYRIAKLGERRRHCLKATTEVGDRQGVLTEVAELRLEEEGTRLLLPKKLILEIAPRLPRGALPDHERLLQVAGDGAVDPCQHDAVRLEPGRALGKRLILEDVMGQRVLAEDGEEHPTPLGVGVRGFVEDDGDEGLHVDDGGGLSPDGLVGGFKLVEGVVVETGFLLGTGGLRSEATLLGGGGIIVTRHGGHKGTGPVDEADGSTISDAGRAIETGGSAAARACNYVPSGGVLAGKGRSMARRSAQQRSGRVDRRQERRGGPAARGLRLRKSSGS